MGLAKMVVEILIDEDDAIVADNNLDHFLNQCDWLGAHQVLRVVHLTKKQAQERFNVEAETIRYLIGPYGEDDDDDD
jgi:hypothetical protein